MNDIIHCVWPLISVCGPGPHHTKTGGKPMNDHPIIRQLLTEDISGVAIRGINVVLRYGMNTVYLQLTLNYDSKIVGFTIEYDTILCI